MKKYKQGIIRLLYFLLGLLSFSIGFNFFLLPNDLVFGGITGLAIVFKEIIEPSLFTLIVSVSLLFFSYILLGKEKTLKSTLGSLLLPLFLKATAILADFVNIGEVDLLLATIFGGVFAGTGIGLMHRAGYTSGGTDIVNQIFNKYFKISIGKAMMFTDGIIICSGFFYFGFEKFMYALVVLYINMTLADKLIIGISQSKTFYVITSKVDEVRNFVVNEMGHSVTLFNAVGGFSKENQKVLFCVIPTREYFTFKDGINRIDSEAFFVVSDSYEVYGGE